MTSHVSVVRADEAEERRNLHKESYLRSLQDRLRVTLMRREEADAAVEQAAAHLREGELHADRWWG